MRELKIHRALELFLRDNKCYDQFVTNVNNVLTTHPNPGNWTTYDIHIGCEHNNPTIIDCFYWDDTVEGHEYWSDLYSKHCIEYDRYTEMLSILSMNTLKIM